MIFKIFHRSYFLRNSWKTNCLISNIFTAYRSRSSANFLWSGAFGENPWFLKLMPPHNLIENSPTPGKVNSLSDTPGK
jgi:hypothetical protein